MPHTRNGLETNMLVGQIRSTFVDLLRASSMDHATALQELDKAALGVVEERRSVAG